MKTKKYLKANVKVPINHKSKFEIVTQGSLQILKFPQEELISKTVLRKDTDTKKTIPVKRTKLLYKTISGIWRKRANKHKMLNTIRAAAASYKDFPLNQIEYVQLLWDALDEIASLTKAITPIIRSSRHNNLIRNLYIILKQNKGAIIKLLEYEVAPINKKQFELICFKLMDNVVTCNRVLLGCCYVQNSYQTINKRIENLTLLTLRFETIVAFVSKVILKSERCVRTYIPTGYIIRHLHCWRCRRIVSLSGCNCTNWKLSSICLQQKQLLMNPLEDGPISSWVYYITSWDVALQYLMNMPSAKQYNAPQVCSTKYEAVYPVRPLKIFEPGEKCVLQVTEPNLKHKMEKEISDPDAAEPSLKRRKIELIDAVSFKKELSSVLSEYNGPKTVLPCLKRKAIESINKQELREKMIKIFKSSFKHSVEQMFKELEDSNENEEEEKNPK